MSSALQPIALALTRAFSPLRLALEDETGTRLMVLVRQLGWHVDLSACMADLPIVSRLPGLIAAAEDALAAISSARESSDYGSAVASALELVLGPEGIVAALDELSRTPPSAVSVPATLRDPRFWTELAADLPEYLLVRYLEVHQPLIYGALRVLGLIVETEVDPAGAFGDARELFVKRELLLSKCFELLTDPTAYLRHEYAWERASGRSRFVSAAAARVLGELRLALRGLGVRVRSGEIRSRFIGDAELYAAGNPAAAQQQELAIPLVHGRVADIGWIEQGVVIFPIPESPGDEEVAGLYIGNLSWGAAAVEVDLSEAWVLRVAGGLEATGAIGIVLLPERAPVLRGDADIDGSFSLTIGPKPGAGPWRLFGGERGTRLESHGAELSLALTTGADGPELELSLATLAPAGGNGLSFIIEPGEGDSFVQELLGAEPIEATLDMALSWSTRAGLSLEGAAGLEFVVPLNKALGPIYLDQIAIELEIGSSGLVLEAGLTASASLGPFVLVVDGVGLRTELNRIGEGSGLALAKLGDLEITIDFKAPDGIGVSLGAGVASGGGYLYMDADKGQYAGLVELEFMSFGLTAMGILSTKLPDGSAGWSLLLSICAEFTPIPLGFGFTLNGVGGLIGINRSMNTEVLAAAIPDGSIDWLLFPDDPIAQAPAILAGMDAAFPIRKGSFVLGPMVQIGWGVPTIITVSAGILVTLPDPIEIALIGQLDIVLGTDEVALLELHVDLLGTIDFEEGELAIFANIRKAHVVGIPLQGAMAFVADFVGSPYFLLSFGGFNPDYEPPVPPPFQLARMGFGLDLDEIQLTLGSYFAVTSNSVQFGSEFSLVAKAMGFRAEGSCYFHVLILFDPFRIKAQLGFEISVSAGKWELLAVLLDLTVTGPNRWAGSGTATFKFLGKGINFKVSGSFGKQEATKPLDAVDVAAKLRAALEQPEAWAGLAPARKTVRLREVPDLSEVERGEQPQDIHWVWPDGRVEVTQNVAPLNVTLEQFGSAKISGAKQLSIATPKLDGQACTDTTTLRDYFAPAEFFVLSKQERLSSAAYQQMDAGLSFGGEGVTVAPGSVDVEMSYEEWSWVSRDRAPSVRDRPVAAGIAHLERGLAVSAAKRLAVTRAGGGRFRSATSAVTLAPESFVIADVATANVDSIATPRERVSHIDALLALRSLPEPLRRARVVLPKAETGRQAS